MYLRSSFLFQKLLLGGYKIATKLLTKISILTSWVITVESQWFMATYQILYYKEENSHFGFHICRCCKCGY